MKWKYQKIELAKIKDYPNNPRRFTEDGMKHLTNSINKFGLAEPLVLNKDLTLIGGHARKKVLEAKGEKFADCFVAEKLLNKKDFDELNLRLNANFGGEFDWEVIQQNFDEVELKDWGVDVPEFDYSPENKEKEIDENIETSHECPKCGYKY